VAGHHQSGKQEHRYTDNGQQVRRRPLNKSGLNRARQIASAGEAATAATPPAVASAKPGIRRVEATDLRDHNEATTQAQTTEATANKKGVGIRCGENRGLPRPDRLC
jgi:hypothetical protein